MSDLMVAFANARLDEVRANAHAAGGIDGQGQWVCRGADIADRSGLHVASFSTSFLGSIRERHVSRHDPASVLRDVESTRLLIAEILSFRHDYNEEDPYWSCSQAVSSWSGSEEPGSGCANDERAGNPCDCGRDARVARMLGIIVSRWDDHPDYEAAWKP